MASTGTNVVDESIATLQMICADITQERASELLEAANGNVERAIDIFFHQQNEDLQQNQSSLESQNPVIQLTDSPPNAVLSPQRQSNKVSSKQSTPTATKKHRTTPSPHGASRKQARLDSFFGGPRKVSKSPAGLQNLHPVDTAASSAETSQGSKNDALVSATQNNLLTTDDRSRKSEADDETGSSDKVDIPFERLAEALQKLTDTTKRLVKLDVLKEFIQDIIKECTAMDSKTEEQVDQSNLETATQTLTYALRLVLGFRGGDSGQAPLEIGGSALSKALQTILGVSRTQLSKGYRQFGDAGDAAASLFQKKTLFAFGNKTAPKKLTILQVYQFFERIVTTDGRDAKQHVLLQLLRGCQSKTEIRFLVRLLIGNMRVGANLKTVLAALAMAIVADGTDTKLAIEQVQKTHDVCPNLESIIRALLGGGIDQMHRDCQIQLLTPIAPMLAHPTHSLDEVAKQMQPSKEVGRSGEELPMTMEWKYDGVRCQAHYDGKTVRLFSRHMLDTTEQYPDAAQAFLEASIGKDSSFAVASETCPVTSFIVDAEIVGIARGDENSGERLLPFQDLSRRKKKNDDGQGVEIKVFAFDLMLLSGESFIRKSLRERRAALQDHFRQTSSFSYVSSQDLATFDEGKIRGFLEGAVKGGAEGLMLKLLGESTSENSDSPDIPTVSPYEAGTRSHSWLKVKRDYVAGYADTIDVVPIGAWHGSGRKAQRSYLSPVLLAVYDDEDDVYRSISRCMSFTDAMYESMREFYFKGTPYPPSIGIDMEKFSELEVLPEGEKIDGQDEPGGNERLVGEEENMSEADLDDDNTLVNCYKSRPSSAYVVTNESPPFWFKPMEVFEVSFADMTLSRQHTAGAGLIDDSEGRGIALRFPRFKRRRPDKKPEQATTSLQIAQMFAQQAKQQGTRDTK